MKKSKIVEKFFKFTNKENTKFNFNLINNQDIIFTNSRHNKNISFKRNLSFEDSKTIIDNTKHIISFNFLSNNNTNTIKVRNSYKNINKLNLSKILSKNITKKKKF